MDVEPACVHPAKRSKKRKSFHSQTYMFDTRDACCHTFESIVYMSISSDRGSGGGDVGVSTKLLMNCAVSSLYWQRSRQLSHSHSSVYEMEPASQYLNIKSKDYFCRGLGLAAGGSLCLFRWNLKDRRSRDRPGAAAQTLRQLLMASFCPRP